MSPELPQEGEREPIAANRRLRARAVARLRIVRGFAVFAALLMILTAFGVVSRTASADVASTLTSQSAGPSGSTYGPGTQLSPLPGGGVQSSNLATFQRWDGVYLPWTDLNESTGNWTYRVQTTATSFTISRLGLSFMQAKVPAAIYDFRPDRIKETLVVNSSFPTVILSPSISIPFSTVYGMAVSGASISLFDAGGNAVWRTAPFEAWDSAVPAHAWSQPISYIGYTSGLLALTLNKDMLGQAAYPLFIDPTWTLGGASGWGASTFANATADLGDGSIKIGFFADNFNKNVATGWTTLGTNVQFASGVMQMGASSDADHSASWYNQQIGFTANFTASSQALQADFRRSDFQDYYDLSIQPQNRQIFMFRLNGGVLTSIGSVVSKTIATNTIYSVRIVAEGNYFEVWWQNQRIIATTDSPTAPVLTGDLWFHTEVNTQVNIDNVRAWNTNAGSLQTPVRNAGSNRPLQTEAFGTVDAFNETHLQIRSSTNNLSWGPWTNVKADTAMGIPYAEPNQTELQYYQLQVTLTTGTNGTPVLTQISTTEGAIPSPSPTANSGMEPWYPFVGGMVNLVNGNLYYATADLVFRGKGFSLAVARSYNSLLASNAGPFGPGWTFNYGQSLTANVNGNVTWNGPDGSSFLFVAKGTTGGFSPPAGVPGRLVKNSDGTYTLWMPDGTSAHFGSSGLLLSLSDRNGNQLTMTYSTGSSPLLTKVADATAKALSFTYDRSNRVITVTDPAGRQVSYAYGSTGLASVTDPLGNKWQYTYYSGKTNYVRQLIDPVGKSTLVKYVSGGQVASLWLQSVNTATLAVNWQFREYSLSYNTSTTQAVQNARNVWTTITLNSFGNPSLVKGAAMGCSCDTGGNSSSYTWDGEMNKIARVDGRGDAWSMTYGVRRNSLTTTDPGGNVSSEAWLEANNATNYFVVPSSTTTFLGFMTTTGYDSRGNLLTTTDPGGNTTRYAYDANGFLNKTVSARGYTTWFVYNASGWLVKQEDNLSQTTTYTYDGVGRPVAVTSPLGFVTKTAYDADSRITRTTDPLGNFTTFAYNGRGDLIQTTDPDGATTTYTINVTNGKNQAIKDSGGNTTSYTYDSRNNFASVKDANLHTTTNAYDAFDRLTKVTTPLGYTTSYIYDAAGNRISRTDGNGYTTKYAYDKLNRLSHTYYPGSPIYSSPQTLNYTYDKDGNLVSATGFGYTETRSFDKSDRLVSTTFNYGTFSSTVIYTYDKDGNRATMTLKDASTSLTTYFYDKVDRLTGILDSSGRNTTSSYDRDWRLIAEKDPNGIVQTSLYDKASRLKTRYTNNSAGTTIETLTYGYDNAGLETSVKDVSGSTTTITTYTYDKNHRSYSTVQGTSTVTDTYDAVGNPIKEVAGTTTTYAYDADNENTFANYTGGISWAYSYDKDGNRVAQGNGAHGSVTGFNYDYENRLIAVVRGIVTVCSYTYAPTGEQITDTCATAPDMMYDSASPGGSSNLAADYSSTGARQDQYLQANSVDSPVEMLQGSTYYGYQVDGLGSVKRITDVNGNTAQTYTYDAWGNTSASTSLANPFQFAGRPIDSATGLYYDRARFYDPSTTGGHRFLSQDPMGGGYTYAGDSPANFVDPTGMSMAPPPEPCNNCGPPPAPSGPPPPPPPKPINPLKVIICAASILAFIGSIVVGFLGLYIDLNAIAGGLYIASMGWGLDLPGILAGGVANIGSWLQLFLDVAIYAWEYASRFIPWWDLLWEGPAEALKLNPVGVAVEAAFLGIEIALSLPGLVSACSDL